MLPQLADTLASGRFLVCLPPSWAKRVNLPVHMVLPEDRVRAHTTLMENPGSSVFGAFSGGTLWGLTEIFSGLPAHFVAGEYLKRESLYHIGDLLSTCRTHAPCISTAVCRCPKGKPA